MANNELPQQFATPEAYEAEQYRQQVMDLAEMGTKTPEQLTKLSGYEWHAVQTDDAGHKVHGAMVRHVDESTTGETWIIQPMEGRDGTRIGTRYSIVDRPDNSRGRIQERRLSVFNGGIAHLQIVEDGRDILAPQDHPIEEPKPGTINPLKLVMRAFQARQQQRNQLNESAELQERERDVREHERELVRYLHAEMLDIPDEAPTEMQAPQQRQPVVRWDQVVSGQELLNGAADEAPTGTQLPRQTGLIVRWAKPTTGQELLNAAADEIERKAQESLRQAEALRSGKALK